ncbi:MAG: metallophosphoesterase family protein [Lentisphaeria bacterium]|nr:metallophosphoesterase family protein [Lentisphaeria bacterium]
MARYAILSDIHSNLEALTTVLEKCRELGITEYISLGDVVGYNANPNECLNLVRQLNIVARVRGNHDDYTVRGDISESGFNPNAKRAVAWTREQIDEDGRRYLDEAKYEEMFLNATLVHATLDTPSNWGYILDQFHAEDNFSYQRSNLCFCGHSHVPVAFVKKQLTSPGERPIEMINAWSGEFDDEDVTRPEVITVEYRKNNKYLFNVGSIGQPRNGDPRASFAIWDTDQMTMSRYLLPYDIKTTQQKILDAGLPARLAERLEYGS